jgi:hypothetical protein
MKRIAVCMLLGAAMSVGFVGCAEKTKVQEKKTVSEPGGSTTTTTTTEQSKTGEHKDNANNANPPPANP